MIIITVKMGFYVLCHDFFNDNKDTNSFRFSATGIKVPAVLIRTNSDYFMYSGRQIPVPCINVDSQSPGAIL